MDRATTTLAYLERAQANLSAAKLLLEANLPDPCASRAYYAAFHAVTAAVLKAGLLLPKGHPCWSHKALPGLLSLLTDRRKLYPAELKNVLRDLQDDRMTADYGPTGVSVHQARKCAKMAEMVVDTVGRKLGSHR